MEEKLINRIIENYQREFYKNKDYGECLAKAKKAYRLLEKDQFKGTKEKFYIYTTLLMIIRCKIKLKRNKTKIMLKYLRLSLYYSITKSDRMFIYYMISTYYKWIKNNIKREYYFIKVNKYEIGINKEGYFSKTYNKFIE